MASISCIKLNRHLAKKNLVIAFVDAINRDLGADESNSDSIPFDIQAQMPCVSVDDVSEALQYLRNKDLADDSDYSLALHPKFFNTTPALEACIVMGTLLDLSHTSKRNIIEYTVFSLQAKIDILNIHMVIHSIALLLQHKLIDKQIKQTENGTVTSIVIPQLNQTWSDAPFKQVPSGLFKQSIPLAQCSLTNELVRIIESTTHFTGKKVQRLWQFFCSLSTNSTKHYSKEQWETSFIDYCNNLYQKGQKLYLDWRPIHIRMNDTSALDRFISHAIEYEMVGSDWERIHSLFEILINNYQYALKPDLPQQLKMQQRDITISLQLACLEWAQCNDFSTEFMYKNTLYQLENSEHIENTYPQNVGLLISSIRNQWTSRYKQNQDQSLNLLIQERFPELTMSKTANK